jgi:hypothetical protein
MKIRVRSPVRTRAKTLHFCTILHYFASGRTSERSSTGNARIWSLARKKYSESLQPLCWAQRMVNPAQKGSCRTGTEVRIRRQTHELTYPMRKRRPRGSTRRPSSVLIQFHSPAPKGPRHGGNNTGVGADHPGSATAVGPCLAGRPPRGVPRHPVATRERLISGRFLNGHPCTTVRTH